MSIADSSHSHRLALSARALRTGDQPVSYIMSAAVRDPHIINLAAGLVDSQTLPVEEAAIAIQRVLADPRRARAALQYDTTIGLSELRQEVLNHLAEQDGLTPQQMSLLPAEVIITGGSQQLLGLIGDTLIDPGDIVITSRPCYFVYTATLTALGARMVTAPMDDLGLDVAAVQKLLESLQQRGELDRVKMIYVGSYYQNPTGLTLAVDRRQELLEIVRHFSRRHRILILEDAAYRELRYDGPGLPSIKSFDRDNQFVILTNTFSKPFSPGLRTGYTVMPADLHAEVMKQKENQDFGSASFAQHVLLEALREGLYARHVNKLRQSYRAKRDVLLNALAKYLPANAGIHWTHPHGGLFSWLTLPESIDTGRGGRLFAACLRRGMMYLPGEYCFQTDESGQIPRNQMRLAFGRAALEQLEPAIAALAQSVVEILNMPDERQKAAAT